MDGRSNQRATAKRAREEVGRNNNLASRDEPEAKRRCVRSSTRKQTVEARKDQMPKHRIPRKQYEQEVEFTNQYAEQLKKSKIQAAQDKKLIWNGVRSQIGWTQQTTRTFWNNHNNGGWICSLQSDDDCTFQIRKNHHKGLAIGHKVSFYTNIGDNCDRKVFCDGENHWYGYLRSDVIRVNENLANLEPQCTKCNSNTHTEGRGGFEPQKLRDFKCRSAENCTAAYVINGDGTLTKIKHAEAKPKKKDLTEEGEDETGSIEIEEDWAMEKKRPEKEKKYESEESEEDTSERSGNDSEEESEDDDPKTKKKDSSDSGDYY